LSEMGNLKNRIHLQAKNVARKERYANVPIVKNNPKMFKYVGRNVE